MRAAWLLPLALVACTGKEETDDSNEAPPLVLDDTGDCNANAPVIDGVTVKDGGIIDDPDQGEQQSIQFDVAISDEDGDLDVLSLRIWYDDALDGTVDTSGDPAVESLPYAIRDEPCNVFGADFSLRWGVTGNPLDFGATYDFAVVAVDSHGVPSAPGFATGTTPTEDTSG